MRAPWNGPARVLDGKATAATLKAELKTRVAALRERGITPGLATVLVGEDPGSVKYVAGKHSDCAEVGIDSIRIDLPATASQAEVAAAVTPTRPAPATSSSCRCPPGSTPTRSWSASTPTRTPMACTPPTWVASSCAAPARSPRRCRARPGPVSSS